jgi:cytochrome c
MFMRNLLDLSGFRNLTGLCLMLMAGIVSASENSPHLGKPAPQGLEKSWNLDVFPDGRGLPSGAGTAVQGGKVYQYYCLSCHGVAGTGDSADELAGAKHGLTDNPPDKTIGSYWPYATTIFDFTRRSMPLNAPGILNNDQLYAVTAYLLYLNHLIKETEIINATTLPKVKMPNRNGFINSYHPVK